MAKKTKPKLIIMPKKMSTMNEKPKGLIFSCNFFRIKKDKIKSENFN